MDVENYPIFKETNLGETHFSTSTIVGGKICSNNLPIKHYQKMTQQVNIDSTWNISSCSTELGQKNSQLTQPWPALEICKLYVSLELQTSIF